MYKHVTRGSGGGTTVPQLAELSLFEGCGRAALAQANQLLTAIELPAGRVLMKAGELGHEFMIIASGELGVESQDGTTLAVLGAGDIVGELALLGGSHRNATVTTLTPSVVYVGNIREFYSLLDIAPSIRQRVTRAAMTRLPA
jgi:CRP-like cAMP-binding protein